MRSASQRLTTLVTVASTAAAGGSTATRMSISRLGSETPARSHPGSDGARAWILSMRSRPLRSDARKPSRSLPSVSDAGDHDRGADDRGPEHQMADRIPFEPAGRAPAGRASSAR